MVRCYKDITFCGFSPNCADAAGCHRALTPDVQAAATLASMPLCLFMEEPECFKQKEECDVD